MNMNCELTSFVYVRFHVSYTTQENSLKLLKIIRHTINCIYPCFKWSHSPCLYCTLHFSPAVHHPIRIDLWPIFGSQPTSWEPLFLTIMEMDLMRQKDVVWMEWSVSSSLWMCAMVLEWHKIKQGAVDPRGRWEAEWQTEHTWFMQHRDIGSHVCISSWMVGKTGRKRAPWIPKHILQCCILINNQHKKNICWPSLQTKHRCMNAYCTLFIVFSNALNG